MLEHVLENERILDPIDAPIAFGAGHQHCIETARHLRELRMLLKPALRGERAFFHFSPVYRLRSTAEQIRFALPHFHEHQGVTVAHHDIQFPDRVLRIPFDQAQTFILQKAQGAGFRQLALLLFRAKVGWHSRLAARHFGTQTMTSCARFGHRAPDAICRWRR